MINSNQNKRRKRKKTKKLNKVINFKCFKNNNLQTQKFQPKPALKQYIGIKMVQFDSSHKDNKNRSEESKFYKDWHNGRKV